MIKRPLHLRFSSAVRDGRKFTTIRDKPWPVGVPIMLYHWSGVAYRSPQIDVAPIIVLGFWPIQIAHLAGGAMRYVYGMENAKQLHETEGFESREQLDEWFRPLVKPGQVIEKTLMRFRRIVDTQDLASALGWKDLHGGPPEGAYWRGVNPKTGRVEMFPEFEIGDHSS